MNARDFYQTFETDLQGIAAKYVDSWLEVFKQQGFICGRVTHNVYCSRVELTYNHFNIGLTFRPWRHRGFDYFADKYDGARPQSGRILSISGLVKLKRSLQETS